MKNILRSRLTEPLDEMAKNFLSSLKDDLEIVEEDILGTMAHDYMLFKQGVINEDEIKLILKALLEIRDEFLDNNFSLDETYEDIHPLIEAKVIEKIGIDAGGKMHSGRSRNDQVAVDIRLKLRKLLLDLSTCVLELVQSIVEKSRKHTTTSFPLFTHLQPAQIGTFSHLLTGWGLELLRHVERLSECFARTNLSPLGACAIGGTSFPIDRRMTADFLGFSGIMVNSLDAISSRDVLIEHASVMASLFTLYSRIATDLIIFSSSTFKFIDLPDKFCSVSSVLPQKKNPDTLELIRGNSALAISTLNAELLLAKGTPSGYNMDFQECKPPLWHLYEKIIVSTKLLARIIEGLELQEENIKKCLETSDLLALDLAEYICLDYNVPFRKSHELLANIVKQLQSEGLHLSSPLSDDIVKKIKSIANTIVGNPDVIDEQFISMAQNLDSFEQRRSEGSPASKSVEIMISMIEQECSNLNAKISHDIEHIKEKTEGFLNDMKEFVESP
ncbi:MAG TPA: argininosuccinate lyase [Candidatus Lokiarchaeia archaeon]|nr:argininosuccinate lyase [Candidatus Lokiarchaeia archaeon]